MNPMHLYAITKTYQVFLACEHCDHDMVDDKTSLYKIAGTTVLFNYVCPNCGYRISSPTRYPFQRVEYDKSVYRTCREDEIL